MTPGSEPGQAVERLSRQSSGEQKVEQGYCSDWTVVGELSSHFRYFAEKLVESCAAERSCDYPCFAEHQAGEMTGPENQGRDSAVFQKSMLADLARYGEGWRQAEGKVRGDSFGR